MSKQRRLLISAIILINIFILGIIPWAAAAEELPKSISLDLALPKQPEGSVPKDAVQEKYEEIMGEISISAEAATVVDQIKNAISEIEDLTMDVTITEIKDQRVDLVCLRLLASLEHKLGRLEFSEPSALRGFIVVADQAKMETRMFRPVNNIITVQPLEDASKEALSALNVAQLTTYFDFSQYEVNVLDTELHDDVEHYLLDVVVSPEQTWQVWVEGSTWIPYEIVVWENGVSLGKVSFANMVQNSGLSADQLEDLPKVKEERL